MKEMAFYRDNKNVTYAKIGDKIFCFDENRFIDSIEGEIKQCGISLSNVFDNIVKISEAGNLGYEKYEKDEKDFEEAKIEFMKRYFYYMC